MWRQNFNANEREQTMQFIRQFGLSTLNLGCKSVSMINNDLSLDRAA